MKILFDNSNNFSVVPTEDRQITDQFIDYETGYLIIEELKRNDPVDRSVYYTVIDPRTGQIIDVNTRLSQIDLSEKTYIDQESGFKIITQRSIDTHTGLEKINEKLIEISTGKELSSSKRIAFSPKRRKTVVETYYEHKTRQAKVKQFWREEYPSMSLEDKQGYWLTFIYRHIRTMGELGYNPYDLFNQETYQDWKEKDADIDLILDYVIKTLPLTGEEDKVRQKINEMRGRPS